jgi:aspartate/methionine/tyrosine aminotransferase
MSINSRMTEASAERAARIARRMDEIQPFHVAELFTRAGELRRAGHSVINLSVGEPDFPTPQPILDAARRALERGRFPYTETLGIPELRAAIAGLYQTRYGIKLAPERVVVTAGGSGALLLTMGVLINPGDEVILADPAYPCNFQFVRLMGGKPVGITAGPDTHYQLTPELITQNWTSHTAAALIASPANPTGTIVPVEQMRNIAATVARLGGQLIVDEIYHGITYGADALTALAVSDEAFIINSFSKYFHMTGWRLGWIVAPSAYVRAIERLAQNIFISNSAIAQYAALAAFEPRTIEIAEARRREFQARRDYLLPALRNLGFEIPIVPEGAFYLYADCSRLTDDSYQFAWDVLERAHVAITPGIDFGQNRPNQHLRFSYCTSLTNLQEAVARLKSYLEKV